MTNSLCIKVNTGTPGRVAFAAQSTYASDWPGVEGATRPAYCNGVQRCSEHARQSARPNEDARLRAEYAYTSGVHAGDVRTLCVYCGKRGSFALHKDDEARLELCHLRSIKHYGSSSSKNLAPGHKRCNRLAADRDLLVTIGEQSKPWPTLRAALAWARTPHRARLDNVATEAQMDEGRAARGFDF